MINKLRKLWKNPLVRRAVLWLGPIVIGWVLSKLDPSKSKKTAKKNKKRRS